TCNPDNPEHLFKKFLDSDADIYQQSYVIDDGVLPSHVVEEQKKEYSGTVYYDRYILSLWKPAEGLVYPTFDKTKNVVYGDPDGPGVYYISIDYGTMNPTAMGLWRVHRGEAVMMKEYYYDGRAMRKQKTDEEYYQDLEEVAGSKKIERGMV